MGTNPAGFSVIVSGAVKAVLLALVSLHLVKLGSDQIASSVLAVSYVADVALYLGWVRPRVSTQAAPAEVGWQLPTPTPTTVHTGVAALPPVTSAGPPAVLPPDPAPEAPTA